MKLNPDFIMQELGRNTILVPVGAASLRFRGVVRMNGTAAFLARLLQTETSPAALAEAMEAEYEGTTAQFEQAVSTTLDTLREVGALIE